MAKKKKKMIKAYKAIFSLLWFKDEMKGDINLIHRNGRPNKQGIKEAMANELIKAMRDVTIDPSKPVSIEFEELDIAEDGYDIV